MQILPSALRNVTITLHNVVLVGNSLTGWLVGPRQPCNLRLKPMKLQHPCSPPPPPAPPALQVKMAEVGLP
jgi:hypothetical protein